MARRSDAAGAPAAGPASDPVSGDEPVDADAAYRAALAALPDHVALVLRDRIKGLTAEAGSARALAGQLQRERAADLERMSAVTQGLRADLEEALGDRDALTDEAALGQDLAALRTELAELRSQVEDLRRRLSALPPAPTPRLLRLLRH